MALVEFHGVSRIYKSGVHELRALDNISFTLDKGKFVVILGQSGAGKSTLIRLLFREEVATSGKINVNGRNLRKIKRRELLKHRRSMGMVFQDYRLLPKKNVYDNVAYAMEVTECKGKDIKKRVPEILEVVGLSDKAHNFPSELSGGEQQRVSIARALAKNPKLLLCDEPTGALDYNTGKAILKLLQDMCRERGMTVILITHNSAITPMADRVIKMKNGKVGSMKLNERPVPVETIEW